MTPIFSQPAASRMESNGFPMCIHVSSATQKLLQDVGEWQYFGCREIKGTAAPSNWSGAFRLILVLFPTTQLGHSGRQG